MFYRACEKCGERWLIGEASSCTCPSDKPQEQRIAELEAALDVALEALIWTTGSGDFGEGGIAHEGALKCLYPAINMLKELKK